MDFNPPLTSSSARERLIGFIHRQDGTDLIEPREIDSAYRRAATSDVPELEKIDSMRPGNFSSIRATGLHTKRCMFRLRSAQRQGMREFAGGCISRMSRSAM